MAAAGVSLVLASCGSGASAPDGRGPEGMIRERSTSSTVDPSPASAVHGHLPTTTAADPNVATPGSEPVTLCFIDYGYDGRILEIRDASTGQVLASVSDGPIDLASWRQRCGLP